MERVEHLKTMPINLRVKLKLLISRPSSTINDATQNHKQYSATLTLGLAKCNTTYLFHINLLSKIINNKNQENTTEELKSLRRRVFVQNFTMGTLRKYPK